MSISCQYCEHKFSSISNLNFHQKTAKFCLKLRKEQDVKEEYECEFCCNKYSRKSHLLSHLDNCKNKKSIELEQKYEQEIKNLKKIITRLEYQIKDLQNKNQELALKAIEKPTIVNNKSDNHSITNTYNHLQPINLSPEHIYQVFDQNLKLEDIYLAKTGNNVYSNISSIILGISYS